MRFTRFKRAVMAMAFATATAMGSAGQAQAFSFNTGDLVVAIYGNSTEALVDLGNANTILTTSPIVNMNLSADLTAASGTNPVKYTLFEFDTNGSGAQVIAGTSSALSSISPTHLNLTQQFNALANWFNNNTLLFTGNTVASSSLFSFTTNLNSDGTSKMLGAWPVAMSGSLGQIVNLIQGDVINNAILGQVGSALLTANGFLSVGNPGPAAVPLPAGVVLFGTGLIGLVGVARRSFTA
ncbi:MAG TPA: VPLPA-CTERM sorting domain-containing protein [Nitrospiraceae bacterium]|nr:VPLPA-CTERM sorting domain-containing protein [Nitrospiraceae bacterium]